MLAAEPPWTATLVRNRRARDLARKEAARGSARALLGLPPRRERVQKHHAAPVLHTFTPTVRVLR